MNALRFRQLSALLALPLLLSPKPLDLRFSPGEGGRLRYTMSQELTLNLEEMEVSMSVNGEEHPGQDFSEMEMTSKESEALVFVDEYLKVEDGTPLLISRTYESLGSDSEQAVSTPEEEETTTEESKSTDLEGMTVLFAWNEEEEEWSRTFGEDSEGDEEMLEDLEAEVFFVDLLPEGEMKAGETWEIEPRTFLEATNPVGDIPWDEDEEEPEDDTEELMLDNLEGTVTAEFMGLADEEGVEMATIRFSAALVSSFDEEIEDEESEFDMEVTQTTSFEIDLEGELVWNVSAGHAQSLSLRGPIGISLDSLRTMDGEFSFESTMHQGFGGEIAIDVLVE